MSKAFSLEVKMKRSCQSLAHMDVVFPELHGCHSLPQRNSEGTYPQSWWKARLSSPKVYTKNIGFQYYKDKLLIARRHHM